MFSSASHGLATLKASYAGAVTAIRTNLGRRSAFLGDYDDPHNLTVVHVVASWRILACAIAGFFWLSVSYVAYETLIFWLLLPFSLFWFGMGVRLLNGKRFWTVYTERRKSWSLVHDGLTLAEANDIAEAIRNATGLRLRARGWKLPPGGRKGV